MSARQGSASFVLVIGSMTAIIVGAIVLTLFVYPIVNAFRGSPAWEMETVAGTRVLTYVGGMWEFWAAIILFGILSWVWVRTRQ